jgi:hypothetical protein
MQATKTCDGRVVNVELIVAVDNLKKTTGRPKGVVDDVDRRNPEARNPIQLDRRSLEDHQLIRPDEQWMALLDCHGTTLG